MKSKADIREKIERLEQRTDGRATGSPEWSRAHGKISVLRWVLREAGDD